MRDDVFLSQPDRSYDKKCTDFCILPWGVMIKNTLKNGVSIKSVLRSSPFFRGGLRAGDRILSINGCRITDELDFQFYSADYALDLLVDRSGTQCDLHVLRDDGGSAGVTLVEAPIRRCANKCVFCFIDQMPKGLRKSLYIKDEDIRLSLLNGNYVTMSTFKKRDLDQIARLGLSPLYISVHATDAEVRQAMLGNRKAPDIMEQLDFLAENDIRFHTQIVVCPGFNDGKVLQQTLRDLLIFGDALQSIAVVPVGITKFQKNKLAPVEYKAANAICKTVSSISNRAMVRDGYRKVFIADELFIRASLPIPESGYYEEYPQIENGVGLVRQMLDSCITGKQSGINKRKVLRKNGGRQLLVTSVSAAPFIETALSMLPHRLPFDVLPVVNTFFGDTVTVAGLLTATDVIAAVKCACSTQTYDEIIIPQIMFNYNGHTLDGYSVERIARLLGTPVRSVGEVTEIFQ